MNWWIFQRMISRRWMQLLSLRTSRASLIRKAVNAFLSQNSLGERSEAFGLWGDNKIDGLAYQDRIRGEW